MGPAPGFPPSWSGFGRFDRTEACDRTDRATAGTLLLPLLYFTLSFFLSVTTPASLTFLYIST